MSSLPPCLPSVTFPTPHCSPPPPLAPNNQSQGGREGGGSQQECGMSVSLRTIALFSYFSAPQQTVSRLHSRKRNRGALHPSPFLRALFIPPSLFLCLSPHPSFPFCRPCWSFPRTPPPTSSFLFFFLTSPTARNLSSRVWTQKHDLRQHHRGPTQIISVCSDVHEVLTGPV